MTMLRTWPAMLDSDRASWTCLGAFLVAASALILWLGRDTTYNVDEIRAFLATPGRNDLGAFFEPQNGNLGLTTNVLYTILLESLGSGFLPFRLVQVAALLTATTVLFIYFKRRVGPFVALAPSLLLLFFGSDWGHIGTSLGFTVLSCTAAGVGALLLLERGNRRGDLGACALLLLSLATFSIGLAFLVGIAVSVLVRSDRLSRLWVFALPLALYFGWWLWARGIESTSQSPDLSNLLLVPSFVYTSLAAVLASLSGLNYDFANQAPPGIAVGPGAAFALVVLLGFGTSLARGRVPTDVGVPIAIALTYWTLGALVASELRGPLESRYMYPGAVMVLLAATTLAANLKLSRFAVTTILAIAAIGLCANLALLKNGTAWFRQAYSAPAKAQFAMLDLARGRVDASFDPRFAVPASSVVSTPASSYLVAADRYGSPGFTLPELSRQPEAVRAVADQILASALGLTIVSSSSSVIEPCTENVTDSTTTLELPATGGRLSVDARAGGSLKLARFATAPTVTLGQLEPGRTATLTIPGDVSGTPWNIVLSSPGPVEVCGPASMTVAR